MSRKDIEAQCPQTIYVVEDDDNLRKSLVILLVQLGYEVKDFPDPLSYLDFCVANNPKTGCLILDIRLPHMSGLELQNRLSEANCSLPIIFVTAHADVPMAVQAMENGALGFLTKPYDKDELINKVQAALELSLERFSNDEEKAHYALRLKELTRKEAEILPLIVQGNTNAKIATMLGISDRTIEVHRSRIFKKLEANSLAQLVSDYHNFK